MPGPVSTIATAAAQAAAPAAKAAGAAEGAAATATRTITGPEANQRAFAIQQAARRGGEEPPRESEPITAWLAAPLARMVYYADRERLVLTFRAKGAAYAYSGVPEHVALQLRAHAGAPGHYYVAFIRGRYPSTRIA